MISVPVCGTCKRSTRKGAAALEFAMVAPLFFLVILGIFEFGRGLMVQQTIINATREGAREAALPDATISSVKTTVVDFLADASITITDEKVTVTPDPATAFNNEQITVSVSVPYDEVRWIPGSYLGGANLSASTKMRSERLE